MFFFCITVLLTRIGRFNILFLRPFMNKAWLLFLIYFRISKTKVSLLFSKEIVSLRSFSYSSYPWNKRKFYTSQKWRLFCGCVPNV